MSNIFSDFWHLATRYRLYTALNVVGLALGIATFLTLSLGATTTQIMRLMLFPFLRPVFYASLVSWPLAWMFMRNWLSGFENRIALTPLYFLMTMLAVATLCALTVFGRTIGLARAEPARALRAE